MQNQRPKVPMTPADAERIRRAAEDKPELENFADRAERAATRPAPTAPSQKKRQS